MRKITQRHERLACYCACYCVRRIARRLSEQIPVANQTKDAGSKQQAVTGERLYIIVHFHLQKGCR